MDYTADLLQHCPIEIAEIVQGQERAVWPQIDPLGEAMRVDASDACINAAVMYPVRTIGPTSDPQFVHSWLGGVMAYRGDMPDDVRADLTEAMLRIGFSPDHARVYFPVLSRYRIDLREPLALQIIPDWTFTENPNRPEAATWNYTLYLATMGEDGAYVALADKVAMTQNGNSVWALLTDLVDLATPQAKAIVQLYSADDRLVIGPGGDGVPMKDVVAMSLALAPWK
jgi:hypothetical protein